MNPEVLVLSRPLSEFKGETVSNVLDAIKRHVRCRGLCLPLETINRRRPRTCFVTCEDHDQAQHADFVWTIEEAETHTRDGTRKYCNTLISKDNRQSIAVEGQEVQNAEGSKQSNAVKGQEVQNAQKSSMQSKSAQGQEAPPVPIGAEPRNSAQAQINPNVYEKVVYEQSNSAKDPEPDKCFRDSCQILWSSSV
eukprot:gnl/TRDRNA2_/TRDRNA2_177699_c5_seq16.p1 gnl/TRDRNA2_/TRDRNA2_177699_c5~~gnl/TRDRNA2_/TRDRNA2_177699_c5_seq16.p1  ORF type:complete len:224 (+),score=42.47 gnl/TRDRNA2_/TRDRNA2_177699_c5_seq16:93-674(+)